MSLHVGGGSYEHDEEVLADINVTPLVDVMLVLLVIFMITAPMLHQGIEVALPQAEAENLPDRSQSPLILSINRDGVVYFDDTPIHPSQLVDRLTPMLASRADKTVFIKGDREAAYGIIVEVLDILHDGGIERIGMITEPRETRVGDVAMPATVNDLLTARARQRHGARRAVAIFLAVALHGGLAATAAFAPDWFAEEPLPVRYVPVELMPAPAVGRPEVRPEPERPEPETMPEPEPEPEPEEPPVVSPDAVQKPAEEPRDEPPDAPRARPGQELGVVGAGVTLDNPDFTYGYYVDRMVALIRSHWRRPALGGNVEAVVSFRIFEDGRVSAIKIARSSGYNRYDLAALRAVQSAAPLPPLPRSYQEPSLGVHLIFR